MKIHIRYFASFRETTGLNEETVSIDEGATVADVRAMLLERYPRLQPFMERSLCAVNRSYVAPETPLHEGDELVFIPPMGGGRRMEAWNHLSNSHVIH
jgi:molybdopterin synthase sulfur carrier subunit